MAPNLLLYQLLVVALVLICLLIHVGWPDMPLPMPQPPLVSNKRRRTRSKEPKPFTGLIHKPLCETCEQGVDTRPRAAGAPPAILTFTRGRRRPAGLCQRLSVPCQASPLGGDDRGGQSHPVQCHASPPGRDGTGTGPAYGGSPPRTRLYTGGYCRATYTGSLLTHPAQTLQIMGFSWMSDARIWHWLTGNGSLQLLMVSLRHACPWMRDTSQRNCYTTLY